MDGSDGWYSTRYKDTTAEEVVEIYAAFYEGEPYKKFHGELLEYYALDIDYRKMKRILKKAGY